MIPIQICLHSQLKIVIFRWSTHSCILLLLQAITSKGGSFLEAPVSGSKKPAEDGQLVILAAGEKVNLFALLLTVLLY